MSGINRALLCLASFCVLSHCTALAQNSELRNATTIATFGSNGLTSLENIPSQTRVALKRDGWSLEIDGALLQIEDPQSVPVKIANDEVSYNYEVSGYRIQVSYKLEAGWDFVGKQIKVLGAPKSNFTVDKVVPWNLIAGNTIISDYVPSAYLPQFGKTIEQSRNALPPKDFGEFLRFSSNEGALLTVQNPYLHVQRDGQSVTVSYAPDMPWRQTWGAFTSDMACIGAYPLSGRREPREMTTEWHLAPSQTPDDGMDEAEIGAFTAFVRASLINPSPQPITVEVGWTLNDYQIDVATEEGKAEYRRIIDSASALGIKTLLYAPANSSLADRKQSTDSWSWEYVLWLNLGEKIRKGQWDPAKDPIPSSVSEMISYARQKNVALLAYVYPSVPYAANPSWLINGDTKKGDTFTYATLASRDLQDYLIRNLIAFQKRTGIAGYSFDYTWLNLPGSSSYAQWYGWRRVMEALRRADPSIVMDGRQSYQQYGPWSWLAGSYPHPTGNDEQPESFKPFPDLHFDRVSADRTRFVNYWYRNYSFAPEQIIPGYATHQTERSRSLPAADGHAPGAEMMYTRFRPRDWDYLGFRYSFLSSIATGGWNNVVDMIPARDRQEALHFSAEDKAWIRDWLNWTVQNKEYLLHTRTILQQPALGNVDGTAAIAGNHGFLFLFNPNYKQLPAQFSLDETIGITQGGKFLLKEVFPQKGRLFGKPGAGAWSRGDLVQLPLDGTSATVFELTPAGSADQPIVFNSAALHAATPPIAEIKSDSLSFAHIAGEPGSSPAIGVLIPPASQVSSATVNGTSVPFTRYGNYIEIQLKFAGSPFAQAQSIAFTQAEDGSLKGSFAVPQRVFDQLTARKLDWPMPWTQEDYESTWLAPERLLVFLQFADGSDSLRVTGRLDGEPLDIKPAYSSTRINAPCFVGFYADLSRITPDAQHTIQLRLPPMKPGQFLGAFFDNVSSQLTESLAP